MTNSAHRSSESAHRSGAGEPKTEVFIGKTEHGEDVVIVSFVDQDSEDPTGIYLYEPGCEPVELASVGINGVATEFDFADVVYAVDGGEDETMPGDGMVTRAQRDADVENAIQDHDNLVQAYDTLREQAQALVDAVERQHREAGGGHPGSFQWCQHAVCQSANQVEL